MLVLKAVLDKLGLTEADLLGQGGEAWVAALNEDEVVRINRPNANPTGVQQRAKLLDELNLSAETVPFQIPQVKTIQTVAGLQVTVENRLQGHPAHKLLESLHGTARERLIISYLTAASQLRHLRCERPWFGDLTWQNAIRTKTYRGYLAQRAGQNLALAGAEFTAVDLTRLADDLPEPETGCFVHLDAYLGNMLATEDGTITAVIDFGGVAQIGAPYVDGVLAAVYLDPNITPNTTAADQTVAIEWLSQQGLGHLFRPMQRWSAAFWSFAHDDVGLHQWCRSILL